MFYIRRYVSAAKVIRYTNDRRCVQQLTFRYSRASHTTNDHYITTLTNVDFNLCYYEILCYEKPLAELHRIADWSGAKASGISLRIGVSLGDSISCVFKQASRIALNIILVFLLGQIVNVDLLSTRRIFLLYIIILNSRKSNFTKPMNSSEWEEKDATDRSIAFTYKQHVFL